MSYHEHLYAKIADSEENARRIAFVEQCFGSAGIPLALSDRVLIAEGVLTKVGSDKQKLHQFFLFNDILVYGNILISRKKFNKQHIINLEDITIEDIDDTIDMRNGFIVKSPKKTLTISTTTVNEKEEWMTHLELFAQECRATGRLRLSKEARPDWVPDSASNTCMHCHKTQFSVINRKHHCRSCGILVCSACSTQRCLLPRQSDQPLRVCQTCHTRLTSPDTVQSSSAPSSARASLNAENEGPVIEPALADQSQLSVSGGPVAAEEGTSSGTNSDTESTAGIFATFGDTANHEEEEHHD